MTAEQNEREIARMFTGARRISIKFGKLPGGGRIWGGPYSLVQVASGSAVLILAWATKSLWGGQLTPLTQLIAVAIVSAGALWGSGKIPSTRRKIPDLMLDAIGAVTVSGTGRYKGAPVRIPAPHYYGGAVLMLEAPRERQAVPLTTVQPATTNGALPVSVSAPPATHLDRDELHPATAPVQLPSNVIPLRPRPTYATGVQRLLEQANRKEIH